MTRVISDSSCDLPEEILEKIEIVPMALFIGDKEYKDGEELSREDFYKILIETKKPPGSASPSPSDFMARFAKAEKIFVITISSALSSSYNNALIAKDYYSSEFKDKMVYVFDTLNASVGQGLVVVKLLNLLEKNISNKKIIEKMEKYIKNLHTFFVLEKMDNLINSGRMNRILGKLAIILNIKFILGKTNNGEIELFDKARGSKRAFKKLLNIIGDCGSNFEDKILGIAHFNSKEKAELFKQKALEKYHFKKVIITEIGSTIATYADEGAILISF